MLWSLLSAAAPAGVRGLTTEATLGAFATAAAAAFTASAFFGSVSLPRRGVDHDRAGAVRLRREGALQGVGRLLAVGAGEREVVARVFPERVREPPRPRR